MNQKYRTLQDIKLGTTKKPRIDIVNELASYFKISIDDLVNTDLEEQDKQKT